MWSADTFIKKSDFSVSDNEVHEIPDKYLEDLFKLMLVSNKRFICALLKCTDASNENQRKHGQVLINNPISQMLIKYSPKYIFKTLLDYLLSKGSQSFSSTVPQKEAIRRLIVPRYTSVTNLLTNKLIDCLFNVQEFDLNDPTWFNLISKCCKLPVQINFNSSSEIEVYGKTENSMNSTDRELKAFVSVLDRDYTKSSKGYTDRKVKITSRKKCLLNSNDAILEIDTSDSDDFSVSSSDDENCNEDPSFKSVISRYFDRKNEYESSNNFIDFDNDNDIVFSEDIDESCGISDRFNLESSDDSLVDNYGGESVCVFGGRILSKSDDTSLSQGEVSAHRVQSIFCFQGFENPCFEDDSCLGDYSFIKMVNDSWKINMEGIPEKPREAKRVSFALSPTVCHFEPEDDDFRYSSYVLDRMRFRNRILDLEIIMTPFLTPEHRERVFRRNLVSNG